MTLKEFLDKALPQTDYVVAESANFEKRNIPAVDIDTCMLCVNPVFIVCYEKYNSYSEDFFVDDIHFSLNQEVEYDQKKNELTLISTDNIKYTMIFYKLIPVTI